ncbi:hypothetical protein BH24ACT26_BH24ACT26_06840 [soil metagenome]
MNAAPAVGRISTIARSSLWVALALGRVEARKLLSHPASLVGAALALAVPVVATWNYMPVLNRYDALTNEALIPFATGVLIAAHLATMRARRHRTTELFDSLVAQDAAVTVAHLIAVLYASCFALLLVVAQLGYMKVIGGVATPRATVVLIGPALVAFAGAFGVALGRWVPRMFAAPLGIAGLVTVCTALTTNTYAHNREWLSLWVPSEVISGTVSEVSLRPYGWRLLYMTGLVALVTAVALAHHPRHRVIATGLAIGALLGATYAGGREMQPVSRSEQIAIASHFLEGYRHPSCRDYESVQYCALPGYERWVDRWREPTEGVMAALPVSAGPEQLRLIQAPADAETYDDRANAVLRRRLGREKRNGILSSESDINPSLHWGRNSKEGESELAIALRVATLAAGIDTRFRLTKKDVADIPGPQRRQFRVGRLYRNCITFEQGRSIVALWLAARATEGTEAAFLEAATQLPYESGPKASAVGYFEPEQWALDAYMWQTLGDAGAIWGTRETTYVAQLLEHDESEVRATIAANWDGLVGRRTTSDEAAAMLGLRPLPPLGDVIENWGYFRRYRGVEQFGVPQCQ